ncbi:MAG: patatin-like phospholipase family protein [Eubacteriales bacterium]
MYKDRFKRKQAENKIGLVFCGGGGKGSYQIGVWKALEEYGVSKNISGVSGTSVGTLNAALFIQSDVYMAQDVWLDISPVYIENNML